MTVEWNSTTLVDTTTPPISRSALSSLIWLRQTEMAQPLKWPVQESQSYVIRVTVFMWHGAFLPYTQDSPTILSEINPLKFSWNKCLKGVIAFSVRLFLSLSKDSTTIKYLLLIQPTHLMMRKPGSARMFITSGVPLCTDLKMQNVCRWCYYYFWASTFRRVRWVAVKKYHIQGE